jgi:hypothetical protein
LKLEGKVVYKRSDWFEKLLLDLRTYSGKKAERDLRTLRTVLADVEDAMRSGLSTIDFELSTLYSVLRSLGMMVAMLEGQPSFGRFEPITRLMGTMSPKLELTPEDIDILHHFRMTYARNDATAYPPVTRMWWEPIVEKVNDIARRVGERIANEPY